MTFSNEDLHRALMIRAVEDAGMCLADLGRAILQEPHQRDKAKLGGIAVGFQRCAAYVLGQDFVPEVGNLGGSGTNFEELPAAPAPTIVEDLPEPISAADALKRMFPGASGGTAPDTPA